MSNTEFRRHLKKLVARQHNEEPPLVEKKPATYEGPPGLRLSAGWVSTLAPRRAGGAEIVCQDLRLCRAILTTDHPHLEY